VDEPEGTVRLPFQDDGNEQERRPVRALRSRFLPFEHPEGEEERVDAELFVGELCLALDGPQFGLED
jgi:hypothetical protein